MTKARREPRWLRRLGCTLIIGALATIVSALVPFTLESRTVHRRSREVTIDVDGKRFLQKTERFAGGGEDVVWHSIRRGEGPDPPQRPDGAWWSKTSRIRELVRSAKGGTEHCLRVQLIEISSGWPLPALRGDFGTVGGVDEVVPFTHGLRTCFAPDRLHRLNGRSDLRLPWHPIWIGFIADTCVFATPIAIPFVIHPMLRRWRRSRRGLCVRCAYGPLSSATCSECGWVQPRSARAPPGA